MTPADLDLAVARTGHARYRDLTSDAWPDAAEREGYRRIVRELAAAPWPPPAPDPPPAVGDPTPGSVPLAEALRVQRVGHRMCWFSTSSDGCGCAGVRCHLLGRDVGLLDCVRCLS